MKYEIVNYWINSINELIIEAYFTNFEHMHILMKWAKKTRIAVQILVNATYESANAYTALKTIFKK